MLKLERFAGRLSIGGREIRLTPKSAHLLAYLIEHAGQIVPRKALYAAVWPGQRVSDAALTQAMSQLRRELGPGIGDAIRTVPKQGYVFEPDAPGIRQLESPHADARPPSVSPAVPQRADAQVPRPAARVRAAAPLAARFLATCVLACVVVGHGGDHARPLAFSILESHGTALASDMEGMLAQTLGTPPDRGLRCGERSRSAAAVRAFVVRLDTREYARNPTADVGYRLCVQSPGGLQRSAGRGDPGDVYLAIRRAALAATGRDPRRSGVGADAARALEAYADAKDKQARGLLAQASAAYQAALRSFPEQPQINLDYAGNLLASGEAGKARIVYHVLAGSPAASAQQRRRARLALAELEGRRADVQALLEHAALDDATAIKLFESYFGGLDRQRAGALVARLDARRLGPAVPEYLRARLLIWDERHAQADTLLRSARTRAEGELRASIDRALATNHYALYRTSPALERLDAARAALRRADDYYVRNAMHGELIAVRMQGILYSLSVSDACALRAEARRIVETADDTRAPMLMLGARQTASWVHYRCGDLAAASALAAGALDLVADASDPRKTAQMRLDYAYVLMSQGRHAEARAQIRSVRRLPLDESFADAIAIADSRASRLSGRVDPLAHPCQRMLSERRDEARVALLVACSGEPGNRDRPPRQDGFQPFMYTVYGMLAATRCDDAGCRLKQPAAWAAEMRRGEPTPRPMMIEDFAYACAALAGMCDAPEIARARARLAAHAAHAPGRADAPAAALRSAGNGAMR